MGGIPGSQDMSHKFALSQVSLWVEPNAWQSCVANPKEMDFVNLFGLWRASFGNTVMGSFFQRLEFLLSSCETLGSQEHEHEYV